jgi:RHS repeat-associated protein
VVKGAADDVTKSLSEDMGPTLEGFSRQTGTLLEDSAKAYDDCEQSIANNIRNVLPDGEGDLNPGALGEGGSRAPGVGEPGTGDLSGAPSDPVTDSGVGPCGKAGEPVDVVGGQYVTARVDVSLPGVLPVVLRRAYASGYTGGRLFGHGWSSTLDIRLQIDADGVHLADDDCAIRDYPLPAYPGQSVLPAAGARWPLTWDRGRDEITVSDPRTGLALHFTSLGSAHARGTQIRPVTAISDRNGNRITFVRDDAGTPIEVQHSGGYRIAVDTVHTSAGARVEALHLLDGSGGGQGSTLITYGYDPRGRLVEITDSTAVPFVYEYDGHDRITAWIDRSGYRFSYEYDSAGRVVRTRGDGGYLSGDFAYDPANRVTVYVNSLGERTEYHYDEHGHVARVVDPLGHNILTETDRYGRVLSRSDQNGATTRFDLDEAGDIARMVRPDGSSTSAQYDTSHRPTRVTQPDGGVWILGYDERGNLTDATDPCGVTTRYSYSDRGALIGVVDALGQATRIETNPAGLPVSVTDPLGARWTVQRDAYGRVSATVDPLGGTVATTYDGEGRPIARTHPDGGSETWEWNPDGSLNAHTDQVGRTTRFEVGPFRRIVARIDADGARHTFVHDAELRLREVINAQGLAWRYAHDACGRLIGEQDFNGRELSYARDPAGRIVRRVNGAGQTIDLVRDVLGRVIEQRTNDGAVTTFAFDAADNLINASNDSDDLHIVRDALGRVLSEETGGQAVIFTRDALGRTATQATPSGRIASWQYDPAGRASILQSGEQQISFGYDAAGHETFRWIGDDTAVTSVWDVAGRLAARTLVAVEGPQQARTSRVLQERSWTYHGDGTPETVSDGVDGTRRMEIDPTGRVSAVNASTWTETYAYDTSGNLIQAADTRTPDADTAGTREVTGTLLRTAGRTSYEYDGQGRLTRKTVRTLSGGRKTSSFDYDAYDRLIETTTPDGARWRYQYDPLGRRTAKRQLGPDGAVVSQTTFAWSGARLVEESRAGSSKPTLEVTTWDYEPGSWRPIAQDRRTYYATASQDVIDRQFHAIVTDLTGTPTELVDPGGTVAWRRRAGLWGELIGDSGEEAAYCPLGFPGQYHDEETGLAYNFTRYYDPGTGRYTTPDRLGLAPSPNQHTYVANPQHATDPLGLAELGPFPNRMGGSLSSELALAERLGVEVSVPGTPAFDEAINAGTVKWAVLDDGSLAVMPKFVAGQEISHSVLSGGAPVLAAGEADIAGSAADGYFGLGINRHSGHFQPSADSLQTGVDKFSEKGIPFSPDSIDCTI